MYKVIIQKVRNSQSLQYFRFVFTDNEKMDLKSDNLTDAVIRASSARMRMKKPHSISKAYSKTGPKDKYVPISTPSVIISLQSK